MIAARICPPSKARQALNKWSVGRRVAHARSLASVGSETPDLFDVIVLGGGPAGLALAAALRMLLFTWVPREERC